MVSPFFNTEQVIRIQYNKAFTQSQPRVLDKFDDSAFADLSIVLLQIIRIYLFQTINISYYSACNNSSINEQDMAYA
jgi:hypothetical protein